MDENEKIQSFGDMVNATEKLSKPWQDANRRSTIALVVTNAIWAFIVALLICLAYLTPVDVDQQQNFDDHSQTQSYSEGATFGD